MSYFNMENELHYRYHELSKELDQARLIKQVQESTSGFSVRLLQNLGDTLISVGQSLKTLSLSL